MCLECSLALASATCRGTRCGACLDTARDGLYVYDVHATLPADPPEPQFVSIADMAETFATLVETGVAAWEPAASRFMVELSDLPEALRNRPAYW